MHDPGALQCGTSGKPQPAATVKDHALRDREGFVARRLSGWGFSTQAGERGVRRKRSFRPEVMQHLACASLFCGASIQEEEEQKEVL